MRVETGGNWYPSMDEIKASWQGLFHPQPTEAQKIAIDQGEPGPEFANALNAVSKSLGIMDPTAGMIIPIPMQGRVPPAAFMHEVRNVGKTLERLPMVKKATENLPVYVQGGPTPWQALVGNRGLYSGKGLVNPSYKIPELAGKEGPLIWVSDPASLVHEMGHAVGSYPFYGEGMIRPGILGSWLRMEAPVEYQDKLLRGYGLVGTKENPMSWVEMINQNKNARMSPEQLKKMGDLYSTLDNEFGAALFEYMHNPRPDSPGIPLEVLQSMPREFVEPRARTMYEVLQQDPSMKELLDMLGSAHRRYGWEKFPKK